MMNVVDLNHWKGGVNLGGLGTILFVEASAASKIQSQQKIDTKILSQLNVAISQINSNGKQRTAQINDLQNHIDCIVDLFQQPDRANLTLTDLEDCKLSVDPTTSNSSTPSASSTPPQTSNSGAKATQPTTSGGVSSTTQPKTTAPAPTTSAPAPVAPARGLDAVPLVGGLFKRLGL